MADRVKTYWDNPLEISEALLPYQKLIFDQYQMTSVQDTFRNLSLKSGLSDPGTVDLEMFLDSIWSAHAHGQEMLHLVVTVGELLFLFAREPRFFDTYKFSMRDMFFLIMIDTVRHQVPENSALTWVFVLERLGMSANEAAAWVTEALNFGLSVDDLVPYVSAGVSNAEAIAELRLHGVDSALTASLLEGTV